MNTIICGAESNCVRRPEDLIVEHKMVERVDKAHYISKFKEELKAKLDDIVTEISVHKRCRNILI